MYFLSTAFTYIFGLILMVGTVVAEEKNMDSVVENIMILRNTIENLTDFLLIEKADKHMISTELEMCRAEKASCQEKAISMHPVNRAAVECASVIGKDTQAVILNRKDDYTYLEGIGSFKLYTKIKNWSDAREACIDDGGHLAILDSRIETRHLAEMLMQAGAEIKKYTDWNGLAWVGVRKERSRWLTVCGTEAKEFWGKKYGVQEPDNTEGDCVCLLSSYHQDFGMLHTTCDQKFAYICEL